LDPQPIGQDIGKLYADYFTHGQEPTSAQPAPEKVLWRHKAKVSVVAARYGYPNPHANTMLNAVGKIGGFIPLFRDVAGAYVRDFPYVPGGCLLDVGCGNGDFLASMRDRGWRVKGVEPDPKASRVARERYGLDVATGTLGECGRVLRPGGRLVAETPNVESWGHRRFGTSWRGLEPPRHLFLFSRPSLRACAEKADLQIVSLRTSSRGARLFYMASHALREGLPQPQGRDYRPGQGVAYKSWGFLVWEEALRLMNGRAGEDLILIATRGA
jgi:SAM-dependent methyltransferase